MMSETHKHTDVGGSEDVIFEEEDGTSTGEGRAAAGGMA